jgi:multicomponent Na+:H+ antiporter subunit D
MLQLLLFSGLAFFTMLPLMRRTLTITLDFDWFYRTLGKWVLGPAATLTGNALRRAETEARTWIGVLIGFVFRHHGPQGALARSLQVGSMVFWMIVLLGAYLVLYLV